MNARLKYLLDRHLEKTATPDETAELQGLLINPELEDEIKQYIGAQLVENSYEDMTPSKTGENIYDKIVQFNQIPKTRKLSVTQILRYVSAAAIVIVGISLFWFSLETSNTETVSQGVKNSVVTESSVNIPQNKYIFLDDGSTVVLNKGSELKIRRKDGKFNRVVELSGEAYFDIQHDSEHPFIVYTGKVKTKVLGTAFNIKSDSKNVIISVTRGLVEVGDDQNVFGKIKPQEQIIVSTATENLDHKISMVDEDITWFKQPLVFDGISLEEAFVEIGLKFNRKIEITNSKLKACRVSAKFVNGESLEEILSTLCSMREAKYTIEPETILITGGIPCN